MIGRICLSVLHSRDSESQILVELFSVSLSQRRSRTQQSSAGRKHSYKIQDFQDVSQCQLRREFREAVRENQLT